jgi:D-methionine transport system permease protein
MMPAWLNAMWTALRSFDYWPEIGEGTLDTLTMTGFALVFTVLIGLPVGTLLFLTSPAHRSARGRVRRLQSWVYGALSFAVNLLRSVPFLILLILLIPATRWMVGTSLGVQGAVPPLVVAAAPFFARLVESVLREVESGVFETCRAIGATTRQTVAWALLPEAAAPLCAATTVTAIALIGYSAMAGVIGGGGLGDLAVRYGYQRFETRVMVVTVAILVVIVQLVQWAGDRIVARLAHR